MAMYPRMCAMNLVIRMYFGDGWYAVHLPPDPPLAQIPSMNGTDPRIKGGLSASQIDGDVFRQ